MKALLMVAYHYPPEGSSSGVLRTLKFSKYLPGHGWMPHVLTLPEWIYAVRDVGLSRDVPPEVTIHRAWALDSSRHLAIKGQHLACLGVPDRFITWLPGAVVCGLRVIRRAGIRAIFSTSPQPTAHLIAGSLASLTGLPWIADFRDPWIEEGIHPRPGTLRYRVEAWLEAFVIRRARRVTVTTEHFRRDIRARYPELPAGRVVTIHNGYDDDDFVGLEAPSDPTGFEILHAGLVTPEYRDPFPLLSRVHRCAELGVIKRADTRIVFLGGGAWVECAAFRDAVRAAGVDDIVEVVPRRPYRAALKRMGEAAVLLLLQASDDTCSLIPAKAFEYLRVGRPILAVTPPGAAADLVRDAGAGLVAHPGDPAAIDAAVTTLYERWRDRTSEPPAAVSGAARFERRVLTAELVRLLEEIAA